MIKLETNSENLAFGYIDPLSLVEDLRTKLLAGNDYLQVKSVASIKTEYLDSSHVFDAKATAGEGKPVFDINSAPSYAQNAKVLFVHIENIDPVLRSNVTNIDDPKVWENYWKTFDASLQSLGFHGHIHEFDPEGTNTFSLALMLYKNSDWVCIEHPELLIDVPMGMYHCPVCGEMQMAGCFHLPKGDQNVD